MILIVAFLFQGNLAVRVGQVALFAVLAVLSGKRLRWLYFVVMVVSITGFNLLTPFGRVIARIGPLAVTDGALEQGLLKGFAIVGLVFVSLFAVRADLMLPGRFGGLVARLFFYFERILETRRRVVPSRLVASLDEILLEIYPGDGGSDPGTVGGVTPPGPGGRSEPVAAGRTTAAGAVLVWGLAAVNVVLALLY